LKQLRLFDSDPGDLDLEETRPRWSRPRLAQPEAASQLLLFQDRIQLLGEFELALERAEFGEAWRLKQRLEAEHGPITVPAPRFMEQLGADFWEQSLGPRERAVAWRVIENELQGRPGLRRRLRSSYFGRLLASWPAEEIVASEPGCLPALANVLLESDRAVARRLVRDALLAGHAFPANEFEDPGISELLSEDLGPRWLASLGAIRRVWLLPRPTVEELERLFREMAGPDPATDAERALAFWTALRLSGLRDQIPEKLLHEARRRLKRLDPTLHAEYMGEAPRAHLYRR